MHFITKVVSNVLILSNLVSSNLASLDRYINMFPRVALAVLNLCALYYKFSDAMELPITFSLMSNVFLRLVLSPLSAAADPVTNYDILRGYIHSIAHSCVPINFPLTHLVYLLPCLSFYAIARSKERFHLSRALRSSVSPFDWIR